MKRMWMWGLLAAGLSISPAAQAQYETGFEAPTYTANMDLNGQDEFFNPVPATSISFTVNLYSDNPLGIPAPPTGGGEQFALGTGPAGNPLVFARSQRPAPYGDGTGVWTVAYDIYVTFTGTLPTAQNVGSFSTQDFVVPNGDRTCIMLTTWTDPNTAATWDADMVWFNAANTQLQEKMPNTGFQNLAVNHWYRRWMTTDLDTNQVTEVGITDLSTNVSVVHNPTDRYLFGGSAGGPPPPDGFRLFAGGSVAGNTMAFDNVSISQPNAGTSTCVYTVKKSTPKGGCASCPEPGEELLIDGHCEEDGHCASTVTVIAPCRDGDGKCKVKATRPRCEQRAEKRCEESAAVLTPVNCDTCPAAPRIFKSFILCQVNADCKNKFKTKGLHITNCPGSEADFPDKACVYTATALNGVCDP
ncbi:MAG: hypothetical protein FLDDKLPJ_00636 [Phycisphaerae bacterium]|nr:hypothetical protein [Phycisphaerae bacterium]